MKKKILLGLAVTSMAIATGCSLSFKSSPKEVLDTEILIQLKGGVENKSEEYVIRQQNAVLSQIRNSITTSYEVGDRFTTLVNAFSLKVNSSHVDAIENIAT